MGRAGGGLVSEKFTMKKTVEETIAVYRDLLAENGFMKDDGY
jgi:hypothetical protein